MQEIKRFKPEQISCTIKEGFVFTFCFDSLELLFLQRFEKKDTVTCTLKERTRFETINLTDLLEKGIIEIEEGCADIYYRLTTIGKRLIDAIKNPQTPLMQMMAH